MVDGQAKGKLELKLELESPPYRADLGKRVAGSEPAGGGKKPRDKRYSSSFMVKELENLGERGVGRIRTNSSFALKYHRKCSEKTIATLGSRDDNQGRRHEMGHLGSRKGVPQGKEEQG